MRCVQLHRSFTTGSQGSSILHWMSVPCLRMPSASASTVLQKMGCPSPGRGGVWCNPPYGREIGRWVRRACEECEKPYNNFIVMLLPARTDTRWFHDYVYGKARLLFLDGRLKFGEMKTGAPFPSMIAIYARRH
jgi:hypothetical protein